MTVTRPGCNLISLRAVSTQVCPRFRGRTRVGVADNDFFPCLTTTRRARDELLSLKLPRNLRWRPLTQYLTTDAEIGARREMSLRRTIFMLKIYAMPRIEKYLMLCCLWGCGVLMLCDMPTGSSRMIPRVGMARYLNEIYLR